MSLEEGEAVSLAEEERPNAETIKPRESDTSSADKTNESEEVGEMQKDVKKSSSDAKSKFYCEPCGKQYQTAMEWEMHLSSYDHHHKKRWREMNQMVSGRTKKQRLKKEQKQLTRDIDAFAEQFERARKEEASLKASKPEVDSKMVTAIKHNSGTGMVFNLKSGKRPQQSSQAKTRTATQNLKMSEAFGEDSDEDAA